MKLCGRIETVTDLSDVERDQMFSLMETYYANMTREEFDADLDQKQWAIVLKDPVSGNVQGFSTQVLLDVSANGQPFRALFSGDTIVARKYWASNPLAREWGRFALTLIDRYPETPLYWFLIAKGYKTYRFLPLFFHEFYPRHDLPTPQWAWQTIDTIGATLYPEAYDPVTGIVCAGHSSCHLRPQVADISPERLRDADVKFFDERNPGHAHGDELCCLAPLTRENFTASAYRVIGTNYVTSEAPS